MRRPSRRLPSSGRGFGWAALALAALASVAGCGAEAAGPTPARSVLWRGDFETGNFGQYRVLEHNFEHAPKPVMSKMARQGRYSVRFDIPPYGKRTELRGPRSLKFREGDERWFGFSIFLAPGFPTDTSWQVLAQWKNDGEGSPPLSLAVEKRTSMFSFTGGAGHPDGSRWHAKFAGPVVTGRWIDWVVHIKFSSNPRVGYYDVWRNGRRVISHFHPRGGTLYPGRSSYLKIGIYRDPSIDRPAREWEDAWRIGKSYREVSPDGRGPRAS